MTLCNVVKERRRGLLTYRFMKELFLLLLLSWGMITPITAAETARVCLYHHIYYGGWSFCRSSDVPNFVNVGIDNQVSSLGIFGPFQVTLYHMVAGT